MPFCAAAEAASNICRCQDLLQNWSVEAFYTTNFLFFIHAMEKPTNALQKLMGASKSQREQAPAKKQRQQSYVPCPVCTTSVPEAFLSLHVQTCIQRQRHQEKLHHRPQSPQPSAPVSKPEPPPPPCKDDASGSLEGSSVAHVQPSKPSAFHVMLEVGAVCCVPWFHSSVTRQPPSFLLDKPTLESLCAI